MIIKFLISYLSFVFSLFIMIDVIDERHGETTRRGFTIYLEVLWSLVDPRQCTVKMLFPTEN